MQNDPTTPTCLRQTFTQKVAAWLHDGKTTNLYSRPGQGMRRLMDDLKALCPAHVRMVRINMKTCAHALPAFLKALADGMGLPYQDGNNYRDLVNRFLDDNPAQRIWLCLERFEALEEVRVEGLEVDTNGFDIDFLNFLNGLNNKSQVSLLICSAKPVRMGELYIAGKAVSGSKLEFSEKEALPNLTNPEIAAELLRCCPALAPKPGYFDDLVLAVYNHGKPADFLDFVRKKTMDAGWSAQAFKQQLATWKKEYQHENSRSTDLRLGKLERFTRRWAMRFGRVFGIGKAWREMGTMTKIILGATATAALALWQWGEKILAFLNGWFAKG